MKKKQITTLVYHTFAIYIPETNMPFNCNKYATCPNYSMCINGQSIPQMNALVSTMWPGVMYTDDNDANTDADNDNAVQLH